MKKVVFPNYENCIANLPNSILKKYGQETKGKTLPELDLLLEKNFKNIVVILLDGMGQCILNHNLDEEGFFRTHLKKIYSSVFPPTTVAATTSIYSGLQPNEHAWLGWECYFPQIDKNVCVYRNTEQGSDRPAADYNIAWTYNPYESIVDRINASGGEAYYVAPFVEPYPDSFEKISNRVKELCEEPGQKYIICYWNEPDSYMHENGCYGAGSRKLIRELEQQVQKLTEQLQDTIVIVTADHGHMDSKSVSICDYPEILDCLERLPSIEPRALNLFVKQDRKKEFETVFTNTFGKQFWLWSKQEVLENKIFGDGLENKNFLDMLGDYLAIAVDELSIYNSKEEAEYFVGVHAGLTEEEMLIPLIIVETS